MPDINNLSNSTLTSWIPSSALTLSRSFLRECRKYSRTPQGAFHFRLAKMTLLVTISEALNGPTFTVHLIGAATLAGWLAFAGYLLYMTAVTMYRFRPATLRRR